MIHIDIDHTPTIIKNRDDWKYLSGSYEIPNNDIKITNYEDKKINQENNNNIDNNNYYNDKYYQFENIISNKDIQYEDIVSNIMNDTEILKTYFTKYYYNTIKKNTVDNRKFKKTIKTCNKYTYKNVSKNISKNMVKGKNKKYFCSKKRKVLYK